jgi:methylenetetrahydrofolate reductase (NADPH)
MSEDSLKRRIVEFVRLASIEVTPHDEPALDRLPDYLAPGTSVYVAHPPRQQLRDVLRVAAQVQDLGLTARPHLVARALGSVQQLRFALGQLRSCGIDRLLLVAGDQPAPVGPFASTLQVLQSGVLAEYGITSVAIAGHPEGNRAIGPTLLWEALRAKQSFARDTGTEVHIVTQFGFNAHALFEWQRHCIDRGIDLPVHVGLAGPTPLSRLIRYAMRCGIGASMHALAKSTSPLSGLAGLTTSPDELLIGIARELETQPGARIVKPHFFCFGGSLETARWLRALIDGEFRLQAPGPRQAFEIDRA